MWLTRVALGYPASAYIVDEKDGLCVFMPIKPRKPFQEVGEAQLCAALKFPEGRALSPPVTLFFRFRLIHVRAPADGHGKLTTATE